MEKRRYSVNENNQLVIKEGGKTPLAVDGEFSITKDNRLIYILNEPPEWRKVNNLAKSIVFEGKWSLDNNNNLRVNISRTKQDYLVIKAGVISFEKDGLVFEIDSRDKKGLLHVQVIKISGNWQADEYNRICFAVKKDYKPDIIVFEGDWQVNKNQQISYTFESRQLKRKTKVTKTISLKGFWQIDAKDKLAYVVSRESNSVFVFRAQIESGSIYPQEGRIKYRIGIGFKAKKQQVISLFGEWKFGKKAGISFLMEYSQGELVAVDFICGYNLTKADKVEVSLFNRKREPLGITVVFTRKIIQESNAELFLRLKGDSKEGSIEAGLSFPF